MADRDPASDTANNFDINIDDTSPVIVYSPSQDAPQSPDITSGWIVTNPSAGVTLHSTAVDNASLRLQWNGEYKFYFILVRQLEIVEWGPNIFICRVLHECICISCSYRGT